MPVLLLLGITLLPVAALALDIDATALTSPTFRITPYSPVYVSNATVQSFALASGTYAFSDEANGAFSFDVDAGGLVSYDPAFETFLDGAGTATLTVRGFDVSFDATALTCPTFRIPHVTTFLATTSVQHATMLPLDFYGFDDTGSNEIVFHLDYDGHFQLAPGSEDYLFGAGTSTLVIRGFDFTVDATALSSPTFRLLGHSPIVSTSVVQGFTGIPGSYLFFDVNSNNFLFNVDADGGCKSCRRTPGSRAEQARRSSWSPDTRSTWTCAGWLHSPLSSTSRGTCWTAPAPRRLIPSSGFRVSISSRPRGTFSSSRSTGPETTQTSKRISWGSRWAAPARTRSTSVRASRPVRFPDR
jgi:hypothetical protein